MDELTELLKYFDIKFSDDVSNLLKCTICKNVLVDSCFSPCACKFCSCCIEDYLRDGGRPCPGGKDDCKETFLNTFSELLKDQLSDMQISYLSVECPNENCGYRCQFKNLPEHMRTCSKSAVRCVFSYVGCADGCVSINKMKAHLEERSVAHGLALMAHMRNMDNEMKERMDRFERSLESLTTENSILRQMAETNVAEIEVIKQEMRLLSSKEEMLAMENASLKGELEASRNDVTALRQRLNECETKLMADTAEKVRQIYEEFATELAKMQVICMSANAENGKSEWLDTGDDLRRLLDENRKEMEIVRRVQEAAARRMDKLAAKLGLDGFVWRVEGITGKMKAEYSRPFFSDGIRGYKFCLCFQMHSAKGLWLAFHLIRGDEDDLLQWPMRRTVLIEVIDEQNMEPVMSRLVCLATTTERECPDNRRKAYDKPTTDRSPYGDGFVYDMTYEQIKCTSGAIINGEMTMRCSVLPE